MVHPVDAYFLVYSTSTLFTEAFMFSNGNDHILPHFPDNFTLTLKGLSRSF